MKKIILAVIAATATMSAAQAQMVSKPYIGLGVTSAKHEMNMGPLGSASSEGTKAAPKIFFGAEITPMFGVEAGHTVSKSDHDFTIAAVPGSAESRTRRSYLAAKANMPISETMSVYGKLGAAHVKTTVSSATPFVNGSESDNGVYAGIGTQYNLNENMALTLEYERYGKKKDFGARPDAVTVAARYSF